MEIEQLRNLGPISAAWLRSSGIETIEDLQACGAVVAFRRVKSHQGRVSLNLLWAMEAGLRDMHWRELPDSLKQRLRKEAGIE